MNYSLKEALKYQQRDRLTVAQIHPSLRFTRLGAVLREHATAPDEVGALAHQALTSDHNQPLELMPLHLLKDRMQEEPDHPLAKEFNWERVPEGVQQDVAVQALLDSIPKPAMGLNVDIDDLLSSDRHPIKSTQVEIDKARKRMRSLGLTPDKLKQSQPRLSAAAVRRNGYPQEDHPSERY